MIRVFSSPLLVTLLTLNLVGLFALIVPFISPLPDGRSQTGTKIERSLDKDAGQRSLNDYSSALDRPLFHTNRRKPVKEVAVVAPTIQQRIEAPYTLVGILGGGPDNSRSAYLEHKETGDTISVRQGETAGSWLVDTIGQDFVTLLLNNERRVIQLANGG